MPKVYFTVDVEPDCPPFLWTHRGVDEGCPRLLDLFAKHGVVATLFCTGAVARRSPDAVRRWLAEGHELGCHGDEHVRLSSVPLAEAYEDVARATETLSRFAPPRASRILRDILAMFLVWCRNGYRRPRPRPARP